MQKLPLWLCCACLGLSSFAAQAQILHPHQPDPEQTLWFNYPATDWRTQALHLGNGYMGISFYGGVDTEHFDWAEETFWTGGPQVTPNYNYGIIPGGKEHIDEIRQCIAAGDIAKADELTRRHIRGNYEGYGFFSKVGTVHLDFTHDSTAVTDYRRGIDLSKALGYVNYRKGDTQFCREYCCSYPDHCFAAHVSANRKGEVSFQVRPEWQYSAEKPIVVNGNEWLVRGKIEESGMRYCVRIRLDHEGGRLTCTPESFRIDGANQATVVYTVETEYDATAPHFKGKNPEKATAEIMAKTAGLSYEEIRQRHIADYRGLYDRVNFHLTGDPSVAALPTDRRIAQLKAGNTDDAQLKALWFNLGRYAIISASRPGTLPSTLQGVWNHFKAAPWNGNFQSNINLQEMYWSCGPTRLPECQQAYIDWIARLVPYGRKVAQAYYGTEGWVSHATSNIWGYAAPGNDLLWGNYPIAAAWHCRHLWDQYLFTGNTDDLKAVYPIMREAATFYLANLQEGPEGTYLAPSVTAEHGIEIDSKGQPVRYSTQSGESNAGKIYLTPCFQDIEMMHDLFSNVVAAAQVLKCDKAFAQKVEKAKAGLVPLKIGRYGQLQEWLVDADNPRDHHRHIAHLYALYPGEMITAEQTPELFEAARVSLNQRGDGVHNPRWPHSGGNWSSAWRMACRARLLEGDRALRIFNDMIRNVGFENMMSSQSGNMQVDAMMATPALFSELLLQSHDNCLHLLPALPTEWPEGEIKGIAARGGYIVSLKWAYGQLTEVSIELPKGKRLPRLKLNNRPFSPKDKRLYVITRK